MVPFPLSRSPHPSSGTLPTYRKPARPAPFGARRTKACKAAAVLRASAGEVLGSACRPRSRPLQPVPFLAQGGFLHCRARRSPGGLRSCFDCAVSPAAASKGAAGADPLHILRRHWHGSGFAVRFLIVLSAKERIPYGDHLQRAKMFFRGAAGAAVPFSRLGVWALPQTSRGRAAELLSAWDGGELVGLVRSLDAGATAAFIHYLLVKPGYQKLCIGGTLLGRLLEAYREYLYAKIMPSDPKTIPFYEKFGFRTYDNYSAMVITRLGSVPDTLPAQ